MKTIQDEAYNGKLEAKVTARSFAIPSHQSYCVSMSNGAAPWSPSPVSLSIMTKHGVVLAQATSEAEGNSKTSPLKEHDYMGLSSSEASSSACAQASIYNGDLTEKEVGLALDSKETELRLGIGPPQGAAETSEAKQDVNEESKASEKTDAEVGKGKNGGKMQENLKSFHGQEKNECWSTNLGFLQGANAEEVYHLAKEEISHQDSAEEKKQDMLKQVCGVSTLQNAQCLPLQNSQARASDVHMQHAYDMSASHTDKISFDAAAAAAKQSYWQSQIFRSAYEGFRSPPNQDVFNVTDHDAANWNPNGFYGAARLSATLSKNTVPAKRGFLEALGSTNQKNGATADSVGEIVGKIHSTQGVTVAEGLTIPKGMMLHHSSSFMYPAWGNTIQVPAGWKMGVEQAKGGYGAMAPVNPTPGSTTWVPKLQTANCQAPSGSNHGCQQEEPGNASYSAPVVGWPPVRSFRKNSMASHPKPSAEAAEEQDNTPPSAHADPAEASAPSVPKFFVKANMDGVPIGRKVDLKAYDSYDSLKLALQDMFQLFVNGYTAGQGSSAAEIKKLDLIRGSDYVLTYEDNVGDWMLVGDVPWELFVSGVKRLRIMKSCDAAGLGQRATLKPK